MKMSLDKNVEYQYVDKEHSAHHSKGKIIHPKGKELFEYLFNRKELNYFITKNYPNTKLFQIKKIELSFPSEHSKEETEGFLRFCHNHYFGGDVYDFNNISRLTDWLSNSYSIRINKIHLDRDKGSTFYKMGVEGNLFNNSEKDKTNYLIEPSKFENKLQFSYNKRKF